jgi:hypothetical protein
LQRVKAFCDRAAEFRDLTERTRILIALADLLWDHDETYARQQMLKAHDALVMALPGAGGAESSANAAPNAAPSASELARLRRGAIARIARRDAALARRLAEAWFDDEQGSGVTQSFRSQTYLLTALDLAEEKPEEAIRFANQSLKTGISQTTISFLGKLKLKDESAARRFFLGLLDTIKQRRFVDGNELLLLGCYVFSFPKSGQLAELGISIDVTWAMVDNMTVVNISGREPALPLDQVRAYLATASAVLGRQAPTKKERVTSYVAAYQLLPYVEQYAPDHLQELQSAMQTFIADVPPALTRQETYANLTPGGAKSPDQILAELEKDPIASRREAMALTLCHSACLLGDFSKAQALSQYISDFSLKSKIKTLIAFTQAARLLEKGNVLAAQEIADKLETGVAKAVLLVGLGYRYLETANRVRAAEALNAALVQARKLERNQSAPLELAVSGQFARFDTIMALQSLKEAVHTYNAIDVQEYKPFRWAEPVSAGGYEVEFSLGVKGLERGFGAVLGQIVEADPDGTTLLVLSLKNEKILGEALLALSAAFLKSAK